MWPPHTHHGIKRVPLPPWRLPRTQHPGPTMTQHKTGLTWEPHSQDCSYSKGREKSPRLGASHTGGHRGLVTTERVDHAEEPAGPHWQPVLCLGASWVQDMGLSSTSLQSRREKKQTDLSTVHSPNCHNRLC